MTGGYTTKQAEQLKHKIDVQMAKLEDTATAMRAIVPDISIGTATVGVYLEGLREVADDLKAIVDRRTEVPAD